MPRSSSAMPPPTQWDNPLVVDRAFVAFAADGADRRRRRHRQARARARARPTSMAQLVVATEAFKQRRYDAAVADLDKLDADTFEGITGSILKAWALTGDGKVDDAFASLDKIGDGGLEEFLVFHRAIMADVAGRQADAIKYITAGARRRSLHRRHRRGLCPHPGQCRPASTRRSTPSSQFEAQGLEPSGRRPRSRRRSPTSSARASSPTASRPAPPRCSTRVGVAFAREGTTDVSLVLLRLGALPRPAATTPSRWSSASSTTAPTSTSSPTPSTTPSRRARR